MAFQLFNKLFFIHSTNDIIYYLGQIATYGFPSLFHQIEIIFNIFEEVILITIFISSSLIQHPPPPKSPNPFALAIWEVSNKPFNLSSESDPTTILIWWLTMFTCVSYMCLTFLMLRWEAHFFGFSHISLILALYAERFSLKLLSCFPNSYLSPDSISGKK